MIKTLKISFALKNTYRVNGILYSLKQIPLVKKLLPDALYGVWGLKIFANVLSVLWELCTIFLGKLLYLLLMVFGPGILYEGLDPGAAFLHILLPLTIIGSYANTALFNPSRDKYYAMILMRMDAREYTIVNYAYSILKTAVGFWPLMVGFGLLAGLPLWLCLLLPLSVCGCKLAAAACSLWDYERSGRVYNENKLGKAGWLCVALLLGIAYGLPALGILLPEAVSAVALLAAIPLGFLSAGRIYSFRDYREVNQQLLADFLYQMDSIKQNAKAVSEKKISSDTAITSDRRGFEYLNELFIKRHQKVLWKSSKKIALISLCAVCGSILGITLWPEYKEPVNKIILTMLPYFVFIMYCINRGTGFTNVLFMNCDHSLLTYSFYKRPECILKLFRIRLREIMKVNLLPAAVIGTGLAVLLYLSGGTKDPMNYVMLVVSILCMSAFFSVHYLTIYYLLQPYNAGTEIKSGTYRVVVIVTYLFCYGFMQLRMPTFVFGLATIVFCVVYCIIACVLVYKLAPKTFRIRA